MTPEQALRSIIDLHADSNPNGEGPPLSDGLSVWHACVECGDGRADSWPCATYRLAMAALEPVAEKPSPTSA